eukprot:scaffold3998_cov162-Amphora_coffeaeformis.AAC.3
MGCSNSKAVDTPVSAKMDNGMMTEFNFHNPQPHHVPAPIHPARPPIVPPEEILRRGAGNSHEALVIYSMNARNHYSVDDVYDNPGHENFLGRGAFGTIYL